MEKMKKLFDRVLEVSCIALMSVMTILVTYQVITRYIFNKPSAVSEVLARYMFVWMVLLCAAYVFGLREHMNIPFVKDKLPTPGKNRVRHCRGNHHCPVRTGSDGSRRLHGRSAPDGPDGFRPPGIHGNYLRSHPAQRNQHCVLFFLQCHGPYEGI